MVNLYNELRDDDGAIIDNRTKLFIPATEVDEEGDFDNFQSGILVTPDTSGYFYVVDGWILHQIHKLRVVNGVLVLKDGEQLQQAIKTPLEIEEEQLLQRIAEIQEKKKVKAEEQPSE